jgi:Ribonuclease G/E
MSQRRAYLDVGVGEARGVVTLDGRPERLFLRRDGDEPRLALGARLVARVASLEPALATAFLDLGDGIEAILPFKNDNRPVRGQALEVEIRAEPRRGKLAVARAVADASGEPRLIDGPPDVRTELENLAKGGVVIEGRDAREIADEAEAEILETLHPLPSGGVLAIEPTRALTAIDVDVGERKGADAKRVARQANLEALATAARLLRLKQLGGIVVFDLVGRGHDGAALLAAARMAFGPDNPGVAIGPVGRFGTMELSLPRRGRPLLERLCREDGALSDETLALRLVRAMEREGEQDRAARLQARCAPAIAQMAAPLIKRLGERLGPRLAIAPDPALPRERFEVRTA